MQQCWSQVAYDDEKNSNVKSEFVPLGPYFSPEVSQALAKRRKTNTSQSGQLQANESLSDQLQVWPLSEEQVLFQCVPRLDKFFRKTVLGSLGERSIFSADPD